MMKQMQTGVSAGFIGVLDNKDLLNDEDADHRDNKEEEEFQMKERQEVLMCPNWHQIRFVR